MRVRVKICGITSPADGVMAARAGADAVGLVFYPPSPRHLDLEQAAAIVAALPPFVAKVGLFVDPDAATVQRVLDRVRLDLLQFHGDEEPGFCAGFGVPYLKAARVKPGVNLLEYARRHSRAAALLLDAWVPGVAGGTGQRFDWGLIPADLPLPVVLSGGLDPDNVATAIRQVRPWAVDVSSGVERDKRTKDAAKVAAFIEGASNAAV